MKFFLLLNFIFVSFFWGCGSRVPIADVSESLTDDRVVGDWKASSDKETLDLKVLKFNDKEYVVYSNVKEKYNTDNEEEHYYRFYILNINNHNFVNAQDINMADPEKRAYHFLRYQVVNDSSILVESLSDIDTVKIDDFKNSENLYQFIKANVNNSKLYKDPLLLVRESSQ